MLEKRLDFENDEIKVSYYYDSEIFRKSSDKRIKRRVKTNGIQWPELVLVDGCDYRDDNLELLLGYFNEKCLEEEIDPNSFFEFSIRDLCTVKETEECFLDLSDNNYLMRISSLRELCKDLELPRKYPIYSMHAITMICVFYNPNTGEQGIFDYGS